MTVSLVRAHCPQCGSTPSIFIRSDLHADLVCQTCREATDAAGPCDGALDGGADVPSPYGQPPQPRRHLFRRVP